MKYMTKEWYKKMINMNLYLLLKTSKEAESFSEDYFDSLYKEFGDERYEKRLKNIKEFLPNEIIEEIPDIRVLALNYTSEKVKDKIEDYCIQVKKEVEETLKKYFDYYEEEFRDHKLDFLDKLDLHDYIVKSYQEKDKDIILIVEYYNDSEDTKEIRLKNCKVIEEEQSLDNACFLYSEVYRNKDGVELHFLLFKNDLFEYIVSVSDVEIY